MARRAGSAILVMVAVLGALSLALASDASSIVVDLRGLELLDSTGLRTLLEAQAGEGGERISFVPGNDHVQGVLRLSGLLDELPFRARDR